jgi:hypothetical protein
MDKRDRNGRSGQPENKPKSKSKSKDWANSKSDWPKPHPSTPLRAKHAESHQETQRVRAKATGVVTEALCLL